MTKEKEALKRIGQETCSATYMPDFDKNECCDIIEQALIKAEKEHKYLEIIKEKKVNMGTFYFVVFALKKDYESCKLNNNSIMYNICDTLKEFLTLEEFELLKEVLNNEN